MWNKKTDHDRFLAACHETRRAEPSIKGRPKKGQLSSGLVRIPGYFTPNEAEALRALAAEEGLSISETLRALIRVYRQIGVDGRE